MRRIYTTPFYRPAYYSSVFIFSYFSMYYNTNVVAIFDFLVLRDFNNFIKCCKSLYI